MAGYRHAHGVPIADTISATTVWKVSERFGNNLVTSHALSTLANAQTAILNAAKLHNLEIDGWVQTSARSLVAVTVDGLFLKAPLMDRRGVTNALNLYSDARAGAKVVDTIYDSYLYDYPVVVLERIPGEFLDQRNDLTVNIFENVIALVREVQPRPQHRATYMSLEDRMVLELREAKRRMRTLEDDSALPELMCLMGTVQHAEVPHILCHGDLDLRNITEHRGRIYALDPEPVIAPVEFDVAKLMTMQPTTELHALAAVTDTDPDVIQHFVRIYEIVWGLYQRVKAQEFTNVL